MISCMEVMTGYSCVETKVSIASHAESELKWVQDPILKDFTPAKLDQSRFHDHCSPTGVICCNDYLNDDKSTL